MSSMTVHCYEPQSQPRASSLHFDEPQAFAVYALQDNLTEEARDLRATILRRLTENPPPNCKLLLELEIRATRPGELPTFRVLRVGGGVVIELIRLDSRGRLSQGAEFKSGSRLEATMRDLRTFVFMMEIESELVQSRRGLGKSKPTKSQAVASIANMIWVVPTIVETIMNPWGKVVAWLTKLAKRMGFSRGTISIGLLTGGFLVGAGVFAFYQWHLKNQTAEQMKELEEQLANAQAAQDAALESELRCREQRKELTEILDQIEQTRQLQAEIAMSTSLSVGQAIELGGQREGTDEVLKFDEKAVKAVETFIIGDMAAKKLPANMAEVCLAQETTLGQDLPQYVLVWHPAKDQLCPAEYGAVVNGVDIAGPWGLSQRVAKEFGNLADGADGADPRLNERWSANTLTEGIRAIQEAILNADTGDRPPVSPGQLHQWTLALFDAYNRLPSPVDGAMDKPATECVDELILEVSRRSVPAEVGQPVLPPIALIALGETMQITPTAGCPWPGDAMSLGAESSLRAITNYALILQELSGGLGDEG